MNLCALVSFNRFPILLGALYHAAHNVFSCRVINDLLGTPWEYERSWH